MITRTNAKWLIPAETFAQRAQRIAAMTTRRMQLEARRLAEHEARKRPSGEGCILHAPYRHR